ncbi:MAG: hypothetical protein K8W52_43905 [Deltaproteobacteria bacterium]|nr:hypothetical protein [Deltaproteobacteria bacterium]
MAARVGILAAILAIALGAPRVNADTAVGVGPAVRSDELGRGTGLEATAGVQLARAGELSGWWHVTGAVAHSAEADSTTRELRVGPRFWSCSGGACIGAAADVGLDEISAATGGSERALIDGRLLVSVALDGEARVALVASAGARGSLALSWDGARPAQRAERGTVVGVMLVLRP